MSGGDRSTITIETTTLDVFAAANAISRIKLLKVDAEGHDLAVLRGAEKLFNGHMIDAVVVEVMFAPIFEGQPLFEDISLYLRKFGYRLFDLRQVKKSKSGHMRFGNAVFTYL